MKIYLDNSAGIPSTGALVDGSGSLKLNPSTGKLSLHFTSSGKVKGMNPITKKGYFESYNKLIYRFKYGGENYEYLSTHRPEDMSYDEAKAILGPNSESDIPWDFYLPSDEDFYHYSQENQAFTHTPDNN